jgi:hypothetical protein
MAFAMYGLTTRTPVTGMVVIAVRSRAKMPPTLVVIGARLSWIGMNALILQEWLIVILILYHGSEMDTVTMIPTRTVVIGMVVIVVVQRAKVPNCTNVDTTRTICLLDLTVTILTSCPSLTMIAWT